jgi:hypothetical protein
MNYLRIAVLLTALSGSVYAADGENDREASQQRAVSSGPTLEQWAQYLVVNPIKRNVVDPINDAVHDYVVTPVDSAFRLAGDGVAYCRDAVCSNATVAALLEQHKQYTEYTEEEERKRAAELEKLQCNEQRTQNPLFTKGNTDLSVVK